MVMVMKNILPYILIILGALLLVCSYIIPDISDSIGNYISKDNSILIYEDIDKKLIDNSFVSYKSSSTYGANQVNSYRSANKVVDGKEVEGDVEVHYLTFNNTIDSMKFFNDFHNQFEQKVKEYDNYSTATYTFSGAITRYCYKVVSGKNVLLILSYDKNEYDNIITYLGFEK